MTLPSTITEIDDKAFYECYNLEEIKISSPSKVMNMSMTNLDENVKKNKITKIGKLAFAGCYNLATLDILENSSVTVIGDGAFQNCNKLTSLVIPKDVIHFDRSMIAGCFNLKRLSINGTKSYFLEVPTSIEELIITGNGNMPEFNWTTSPYRSLKKVKIDEGVTSIAEYAFYNCDKLEEIEIPSTVKKIGNAAFNYTSSMKKTNYMGTADEWANIDFKSRPNVYRSISFYFKGELVTDIVLNTTKISDQAFYGFKDLVSVTLPLNIVEIGNYAFSGCSSLTTINIPSSVTKIGDGAFSSCIGLASITIPSSVTSIGNQAFNSLANNSKIYCETQAVADLLSGKYSSSKTTVVVDPTKFS